MDKYESRRKSLQALVSSIGRGAIAQIAARIDKSPSYVSRMLYEPGKAGRKRIGEDSLDLLRNAYPEAFEPVSLPASDPADTALAKRLLALATPRSQRALERIIAAAEAGRLSEADVKLLSEIAARLERT